MVWTAGLVCGEALFVGIQSLTEADVRAIVTFMARIEGEHSAVRRRAVLSDLVHKAMSLPEASRWRLLAQGLYTAAKDKLRSQLPPVAVAALEEVGESGAGETRGEPDADLKRRRYDVAICVVTETELSAAQIALGLPINRRGRSAAFADRYWECDLKTDSGSALRVVLTVFAKQRNVPAAILTERLLSRLDVGLCLLVGIAAGLKSHLKLGDVVAATSIIDYEGARLELDRAEPNRRKALPARRLEQLLRPAQFEPPTTISGDVELFNPADARLEQEFRRHLPALRLNRARRDVVRKWSVKLHKAVILAGEKLIADGSLRDRRLTMHEKIRAAEMESSGFAQACRFQRPETPWAVFRGISDYGDGGKGRLEGLQRAAALAAATGAVRFLQTDFRKTRRQ